MVLYNTTCELTVYKLHRIELGSLTGNISAK